MTTTTIPTPKITIVTREGVSDDATVLLSGTDYTVYVNGHVYTRKQIERSIDLRRMLAAHINLPELLDVAGTSPLPR